MKPFRPIHMEEAAGNHSSGLRSEVLASGGDDPIYSGHTNPQQQHRGSTRGAITRMAQPTRANQSRKAANRKVSGDANPFQFTLCRKAMAQPVFAFRAQL